MNILKNIGLVLGSLVLILASGFVITQYQVAQGVALPLATAVFETSLASPITSSATTLTLSANSVRGGGALSGYTCFTIDEGSAQAETVCGTVSGTTVSGLTRGISQTTGTTTVATLQFAHRRGANVKITDFPITQLLKAQNNGEDTFPNILNYASHPTFVGITNLVDKKYVDDTAFSGAGVISATESAKGVSELATRLEQASSTVSGSSGPLVLQAQYATSTCSSTGTPGNGLNVLVTDNTNKVSSTCFPSTLATTTITAISTTTTVGNPPIKIMDIGKNTQVFTSDGTFTVPAGVKVFHVRVLGGGAASQNTGVSAWAPGGGAGGYNEGWFDLTATTSIGIKIGAGGTGNAGGGTSYFSSIASSTGGAIGVGAAQSGTPVTGGAGGTSFATTSSVTLSAINGSGAPGGPAYAGTASNQFGGNGGSSAFGGGGLGCVGASGNGTNATGYGAGGGGACPSSTAGSGTAGIIVIEW